MGQHLIQGEQLSDPLRIVTTAVAPVVMVSATAILLGGANARYIAISDRMRSLAREYRESHVTAPRKENIRQQVTVFRYRMGLVSWASRLFYAAVACFVAVALLICLSTLRVMLTSVTLPIFVFGVVLVGAAIVLQFLEIHASHRTIDLEAAEVIRDIEAASKGR